MGWIVNQIAEHLHINQVCFLLYFQASAVDSGAAKWVSKGLPTMLWKLYGQTVLQDLSATGTTTESLYYGKSLRELTSGIFVGPIKLKSQFG